MIRVLVVVDSPFWAYAKRGAALQKHAPEDIEITVACTPEVGHPSANRPGDLKYPWEVIGQQFDVAFWLEYALTPMARTHFRKHGITIPLITSSNSDGRRRHELFEACFKAADFVICNNQEVWELHGRLPRTCNISNGVDCDIYKPVIPIEQRPFRCCWCGSSGPLKGKGYQDILLPLADRLAKLGIECDLRPIDSVEDQKTGQRLPHVKSTEEQAAWYQESSVVLCASMSEGTPNFLLEAMASGCVPVTVRVGNAQEFGVHGRNCVLVERNVESFVKGVQYAMANRERMSAAAVETMREWDWSKRSEYFFSVFRALASGRTPKPFTYRHTPADAIPLS